jgi:hypothetical protein
MAVALTTLPFTLQLKGYQKYKGFTIRYDGCQDPGSFIGRLSYVLVSWIPAIPGGMTLL